MLHFISLACILAAQPPVAKREPQKMTLHGVERVDDYAWLRQKDTPAVLDYLKAENAYTDEALTKPTEALRKKLFEEMKARLKESDLSVPYEHRGYLYYSRTEAGKEYPIRCRKKGSLTAPEEVLLDLNAMRGDLKFLALGHFEVSVDNKWLAYETDTTGFRQYTLQFKDLTSGALAPERIEKVTSFAWAADNKTVFYVSEDAAKRPAKLWRHSVGTPTSKDVAVYEEKDERFSVDISRTRSDAFLVMAINSLTTSEVRVLDAKAATDDWKTIATREQDHQYEVDHRGDLFYIRTNDKGRNFRLVSAPARNPSRVQWKEEIPHSDDVMLVGIDLFKDFYVVFSRKDALPQLTVVTDAKREAIPFDEAAYAVFPNVNESYDAGAYRFTYMSFVTPQSVFEYDVKAKTKTLLKQDEVLGGYDATQYTSERLFATAGDGTRVPISLVYKKGLKKDGKAPLLLTGYGSYGFPSPINFDSARVSFLDRGGVVAIAHIRGGGELGKKWHDQGRMMNKKNTFSDFIACADALVKQKFTSASRLAIMGGSAGGLLMGAVINMRPTLFKAVIAQVPFVDVVNTMLDESLPLTVGEFEEWGNPKEKAAFDYMRSYSPYDNVAKKAYPSMLVISAYNDSQVMYFEPAKWVAKLRAMKTDKHPLYLRMNLDPAGHGGKSGRYERLEERAYEYAYLITELGMRQ
jgi:oligopeptidase B